MWSRRLLLWGLASAVAAAALALTLLWLILTAYEKTHPREPMHVSALIVLALPGLLVYPICWYAIVFRRRRYDARTTWTLLAATYLACCVLDCAVIFLGQAAAVSGDFIAKGLTGWALLLPASFLAAFGLAAFAVIVAALLAIPYGAVAAPAAFLHRATLLAWFGREPEAG